MKVTIIHGQNHKGSSYHIGRLLVDQMEGENAVTEFFLPRDLNHFCLGCYRCIENDADCPWYEQKKAIVDAMEEADLLVFTTPTYCLAPSASMKAFIDLTFTLWMSHRPRASMFRKKAVVISTAAGSPTTGAIKGVATPLFYWGVPKVYRYGARVQAMNWDGVKPRIKHKAERDMAKLARKLEKNDPPRVGIPTRVLFWLMAGMQKVNWGSSPTEKQYWQERGWLGSARPWNQA